MDVARVMLESGMEVESDDFEVPQSSQHLH